AASVHLTFGLQFRYRNDGVVIIDQWITAESAHPFAYAKIKLAVLFNLEAQRMLCVVLLLGGNCGEVDAFRALKHFIRNVSRALPFRFYRVFRDAFVFARMFIGFAFVCLGVAVLDISPW